MSEQYLLDEAEVEFCKAVHLYFTSQSQKEVMDALDSWKHWRGILTTEHGYSLEQICVLVDRA